MNREAMTRKLILTDLQRCGSYLLPESTLFQGLNLQLAPASTRAEFEIVLAALETDGLIAGLRNPVTHERRWKLTDAGKLVLLDL